MGGLKHRWIARRQDVVQFWGGHRSSLEREVVSGHAYAILAPDVADGGRCGYDNPANLSVDGVLTREPGPRRESAGALVMERCIWPNPMTCSVTTACSVTADGRRADDVIDAGALRRTGVVQSADSPADRWPEA
jgi:hypothetical protein